MQVATPLIASSGAGEGAQRRQVLTLDLLQPNELMSGLLTQVAIQPDVAHVLSDLTGSEGDVRLCHAQA